MTNETQIKTLIENWTKAVRHKNIKQIPAHHSNDIVMYDVPLRHGFAHEPAALKHFPQIF